MSPSLRYKTHLQVVGVVISCLGLVGLMSTAAYTYQREDLLREKIGFPSLFDASRKVGTSAPLKEDVIVQHQFVDSPETRKASFVVEMERSRHIKTSRWDRSLLHKISSRGMRPTSEIGTQTD